MSNINLNNYWQNLKEDLSICNADLEFPSMVLNEISTADGDVRIGINPQGMQILLLPCDKSLLSRTLPESTGLKLKVKYYLLNGKKKLFLEVVCLIPQLDDVFSDLVENICDRIVKGNGPLQAVNSAIEDFRDLLKKLSLSVKDETVLGLLGELLQLTILIDNNIDVACYWSGPDKKRHDFILPGLSVEVKTTQRSDMPLILIHGLDQLLPPLQGELLLSYFRVESSPSGDLTIPGLIDYLKNKGISCDFTDKLKLYGYDENSKSIWGKYSWHLVEKRFYAVDNNFPKLTTEELGGKRMPGISGIQYTVNLDQAEDSRIKEDQFISLIKDAAH